MKAMTAEEFKILWPTEALHTVVTEARVMLALEQREQLLAELKWVAKGCPGLEDEVKRWQEITELIARAEAP